MYDIRSGRPVSVLTGHKVQMFVVVVRMFISHIIINIAVQRDVVYNAFPVSTFSSPIYTLHSGQCTVFTV